MKSKNRTLIGIVLFSILTAIAWQLPEGRLILYPFTLLGTWFHEMSHGLAALIMGGNFHYLEINSDASGVAIISGSMYLGPVGNAIVAGAGPLGPAMAGAVFLTFSTRGDSARIFLVVLALAFILSVILWVRSATGIVVLIAFAVALLAMAKYAKDNFAVAAVQLLAVQAFMSVFLSIGYLFSDGAIMSGGSMLSDTAVIEKNLFLPYWFWGAVILLICMIILYYSVRYVLNKR